MASTRILVTGAAGFLGREILAQSAPGFERLATVHSGRMEPGVPQFQADLTQPGEVNRLLAETRPDWVIHAAAMTNVDSCERDPDAAHRINVLATVHVVAAAIGVGARVLMVSTDQVFDGQRSLYRSDDVPSPINVYGRTKREAETTVLAAGMPVVRTNFFGWSRSGRPSFSDWIVNSLRSRGPVNLWTDSYFSPIYSSILARLLLKMLLKQPAGNVYHLGGPDRLSKYDFGMRLARRFGLDVAGISAGKIADARLPAARPQDMSLDSESTYRFLDETPASLNKQLDLLLEDEAEKGNAVKRIKIGNRWVGDGEPTYVISEIGSNFDRSLEKARKMVDLSLEVGADAAKFQHFLPEKIVARKGFEKKTGFQAKWKESVYEIYQKATFPREWTKPVAAHCKKVGIHFLSSPYDREAVDLLEKVDVPAYKIGSGDVTFLDLVSYIAGKGKPVIMGVGSCTMAEIEEAVTAIRKAGNNDIVLLQCITNYPSHFEHANIRAMTTLRQAFDCLVGYSDHTPGSLVPLASVALGGCMIEKHFTDDKTLPGPDHPFAMDVPDMKRMVSELRILERALGSTQKFLTDDERETVIVQRRSLWSTKAIKAGTVITKAMIEPLRPQTGILPKYLPMVLGRKARVDIAEGTAITWDMV